MFLVLFSSAIKVNFVHFWHRSWIALISYPILDPVRKLGPNISFCVRLWTSTCTRHSTNSPSLYRRYSCCLVFCCAVLNWDLSCNTWKHNGDCWNSWKCFHLERSISFFLNHLECNLWSCIVEMTLRRRNFHSKKRKLWFWPPADLCIKLRAEYFICIILTYYSCLVSWWVYNISVDINFMISISLILLSLQDPVKLLDTSLLRRSAEKVGMIDHNFPGWETASFQL